MDTNLTSEQISQLKTTLNEERKRLRMEIADALRDSDFEHHRTLVESIQDDSDGAITHVLQALDLEIFELHRASLHDIDVALQRITDGSYGVCVGCEEPIEFARLNSYPTAKRCRSCQSKHESHQPRG